MLLFQGMSSPANAALPFDPFVTHQPALRRRLARLQLWAAKAPAIAVCGEAGVGKSMLGALIHAHRSSRRANTIVLGPAQGMAHRWDMLDFGPNAVLLDDLPRCSIARQQEAVKCRRALGRSALLVVLSRAPLPRLQREGRLAEPLATLIDDRVLTIEPLRHRLDDLPPLVRSLLDLHGQGELEVEPSVWRRLAEHGWSDNVRELRDAIAQTLTYRMGESGPLTASQLCLDPRSPPSLETLAERPFNTMRERVDHWYLRRLLQHTDGNLSEAARRAGCSRKVLRDRLRRLGLYEPRDGNDTDALHQAWHASEPGAGDPPSWLRARPWLNSPLGHSSLGTT